MLRPIHPFRIHSLNLQDQGQCTAPGQCTVHIFMIRYHTTIVKRVVYCSCFTSSSRQENYSCNASVHNCNSTRIVLSFQINKYRVSCIDLELIIILAFLGKDTLERCNSDTGMPNANSTGTSERPSNIKQSKALQEWFTFVFSIYMCFILYLYVIIRMI